MAEEEVQEEEAPKKSKLDSNKIMVGLLALNIVVMIIVVAVSLISKSQQDSAASIGTLAQSAALKEDGSTAGGEAGADGAEEEGEKIANVRFFNIGEFTANLSGSGSGHYVRVSINVELGEKLEEEEMTKRSPQVRDKIITLLNSRRPQDLQSVEGRGYLKEEIKAALNGFLNTGKISGVYFSTFVFE